MTFTLTDDLDMRISPTLFSILHNYQAEADICNSFKLSYRQTHRWHTNSSTKWLIM